jgi:hypothetical protein
MTWQAADPRPVRKAPWAAGPALVYEGVVQRLEGEPPVVVVSWTCGHRHINTGPARKCSEALARKYTRDAATNLSKSDTIDP